MAKGEKSKKQKEVKEEAKKELNTKEAEDDIKEADRIIKEVKENFKDAKKDTKKLFNKLDKVESVQEVNNLKDEAITLSTDLKKLGALYGEIKKNIDKLKSNGDKKSKNMLKELKDKKILLKEKLFDKIIKPRINNALNKSKKKGGWLGVKITNFLDEVFRENKAINEYIEKKKKEMKKEKRSDEDKRIRRLDIRLKFLKKDYSGKKNPYKTIKDKVENLKDYLNKKEYKGKKYSELIKEGGGKEKDFKTRLKNEIDEYFKIFFVSKDKGLRTVRRDGSKEGHKNRYVTQAEILKLLRKKLRKANAYTESIKTFNDRYAQILFAKRQRWEQKVEKTMERIQEYKKMLNNMDSVDEELKDVFSMFDEDKKDDLLTITKKYIMEEEKGDVLAKKFDELLQKLNTILEGVRNLEREAKEEEKSVEEVEKTEGEKDKLEESLSKTAEKEEEVINKFEQELSKLKRELGESFPKIKNLKESILTNPPKSEDDVNKTSETLEESLKPLKDILDAYRKIIDDINKLFDRTKDLTKVFNDKDLIRETNDLKKMLKNKNLSEWIK